MSVVLHYEPNQYELRNFPAVAGELLECLCGRVWKWKKFTVEAATLLEWAVKDTIVAAIPDGRLPMIEEESVSIA